MFFSPINEAQGPLSLFFHYLCNNRACGLQQANNFSESPLQIFQHPAMLTFTTENIFFLGSFLVLVSILISKTGYRFGIPTLLLFLFTGMAFAARDWDSTSTVRSRHSLSAWLP
jgi:hypothetical protein